MPPPENVWRPADTAVYRSDQSVGVGDRPVSWAWLPSGPRRGTRMKDRFAAHSRLRISCLMVLLALGASYAQAQSQARAASGGATLRGVVMDSAGFPLANADVRIMSEGRTAHTDSSGAFALSRIQSPIIELTVRHLGYQLRVIH